MVDFKRQRKFNSFKNYEMTSLGKRRPLTRRLGGETPRKYTVIPLDNSISNKKFTKLPRRVTHAENLTSPDPILRVKQPSRTRLPQIKISQSSQSLISEKSLKHKNKKNTDEFLFEKKTTEIQSHLLTVEALPARLEEFNYLVDCVGDAVESRQGTCICKL